MAVKIIGSSVIAVVVLLDVAATRREDVLFGLVFYTKKALLGIVERI